MTARAVLLDFGETLVERISDRHAPLTLLDPRPFPETAAALAALRQAGHRLAVVSNTERTTDAEMAEVLASLGLGDLIDAIATSTSVGSRKPDPAIFLCALERLGCSVEDGVMVGDDAEVDIVGGAALGMTTVHVRRDASAPLPRVAATFTIASLLEVPAILSSHPASGPQG